MPNENDIQENRITLMDVKTEDYSDNEAYGTSNEKTLEITIEPAHKWNDHDFGKSKIETNNRSNSRIDLNIIKEENTEIKQEIEATKETIDIVEADVDTNIGMALKSEVNEVERSRTPNLEYTNNHRPPTSKMAAFNWRTEDIFLLIELFQEREVLWNTLLDDYKDRNKKHNAWIEIANAFNLDKQTVEKKMRSLIGQFQRECKNKKGKWGADGDKTKKWFAYEKLMFLKDRTRPGSTIDGGFEDNENSNQEENSGSENTGTFNETEERNFAVPKLFRKRKHLDDKLDAIPEEALKILKNIFESRKGRDQIDAFGEYVALKLKEINNNYARNTAQYHINKILYNASIGEYDRPTNASDRPHNAADNPRRCNNASKPSDLSEVPGSSKAYNVAPSSSVILESSQDSTPSLDDLLNSILKS